MQIMLIKITLLGARKCVLFQLDFQLYRIVIAVFKVQIYGLCGIDLQIIRYYESVDDIVLKTLVVASFVWFVQGSACRSRGIGDAGEGISKFRYIYASWCPQVSGLLRVCGQIHI